MWYTIGINIGIKLVSNWYKHWYQIGLNWYELIVTLKMICSNYIHNQYGTNAPKYPLALIKKGGHLLIEARPKLCLFNELLGAPKNICFDFSSGVMINCSLLNHFQKLWILLWFFPCVGAKSKCLFAEALPQKKCFGNPS